MKRIQNHFAGNPGLEMLSVSLDGKDTDQMLSDLIRDKHISYPVLHAGGEDGWNDGNFGWTIHGVPSAYIIDPQGNIFADVYPQASLIEDFDWLAQQGGPLPPVGLSAQSTREGDSLEVYVQLSSPQHVPLDVTVNVSKLVKYYNPDRDPEGTGEPNDYIDRDVDLDLDFSAEFGEFGETSHSFLIPIDDDAIYYSYRISTVVPGMEQLNDGAGFTVSASGFVRVREEHPKQEEDQEQDD